MDSKTVFSKTGKGLREASGASSSLPRALRGILKEIDGKKRFSELQVALHKFSEAELKESLERLEKDGYVRDTGQLIKNAEAVLSSPPPRQDQADGAGDLDFTSAGARPPILSPPTLKLGSKEDLKRKAEEAKQKAEAKARRVAEAEAKREVERQAKLALEKAKQEAEEKARREAEETARREAEEKIRSEAEARIRKEAAEKARLEAEARAKREAEEQRVRREAEKKARREAEEKIRRETEERARKEAEEKARFEAAEATAEQEAEEKARRDAEEKARREAEEQIRREAEERVRVEAEEQARRAEKEKERLAAWELSKRRAEEALRLETENKARREAEDRIRIEAKERAEREAEARLKESLKEQARREAEEKARQEKEARIRKEAEEELRREAKENAKREARDRAEREAADNAAIAAERKAIRPTVKWGKVMAMASLPVAAIVLAAIHFVPFNGRIASLENAAAKQFQQPAKIEEVHFSLFPRPHWRLDGVTIGRDAQIRAPQVSVVIDLAGLFGHGMAYRSIEMTSPVIKAEAARWLLFGKAQERGVTVNQISVRNAMVESADIDLPRFDGRAELGTDRNWHKMVLEFSGREAYVELQPDGERVRFDITARNFLPPFGGSLRFDDFTAKGSIGREEMAITEFEMRNFSGSISGTAKLQWADGWRFDGVASAHQLDTKKLAPALLRGGLLDGKAVYSSQGQQARSLFGTPHAEGSFTVSRGELLGVDLMHLLQGGADSGKTGFREARGSFVNDGKAILFRQLRIDAGILSAAGSAELDSSGAIRGRFATSYRFDNQHKNGSLSMSGTLQAPLFSR